MSDYHSRHTRLQLAPYKLDFSLGSLKRVAANVAVKALCLIGRSTTLPELLEVLVDTSTKEKPFLHLYIGFGHMPKLGALLAAACIVHSEPVVKSPEFQEFGTINHAYSSVQVGNLASASREVTTFNVPGGRFIYAPFMLISLSPQWKHAADGLRVHNAYSTFMERSINLTKDMDLFHPFIYQNYANVSQDVFGGYGEHNRARQLEIQGKYDPERVFANLTHVWLTKQILLHAILL
ncbi:hypothetical protein HYALB_00012937 [Hymenoscyphus albidus]|uniref:Uncharacterized protein n=1 Tax=Hymenoscyphus albidus TaxID=595503 RepID=A0A9N9LYE8_9HELO|nr:hypothetical protein HYALB_00012937 [Hymenoscyphus albidus]